MAAARAAAGRPAAQVTMPQLLREALRSPRELLAMLGVLLAAMVVTAPLPPAWWGPAALLLAAVPGTMLMNRVRVRAEQRSRPKEPPADG